MNCRLGHLIEGRGAVIIIIIIIIISNELD